MHNAKQRGKQRESTTHQTGRGVQPLPLTTRERFEPYWKRHGSVTNGTTPSLEPVAPSDHHTTGAPRHHTPPHHPAHNPTPSRGQTPPHTPAKSLGTDVRIYRTVVKHPRVKCARARTRRRVVSLMFAALRACQGRHGVNRNQLSPTCAVMMCIHVRTCSTRARLHSIGCHY
jgi:hypothetical protein